jgi:plasmid stability protein
VSNLTLSIDEDLLRRARVRAAREGTSVNAVVRDYLEDYAGRARAVAATRRLLALAERSTASSGSERRRWTREELYDRQGLRRH